MVLAAPLSNLILPRERAETNGKLVHDISDFIQADSGVDAMSFVFRYPIEEEESDKEARRRIWATPAYKLR